MMKIFLLPLFLLLAACGSSETEFTPERQFNASVNEPMPVFDARSGIVLEASGVLVGTQEENRVSGSLKLYRAPNSSGLLRIEGLAVEEPMQLDIALSRSADAAEEGGLERSAMLGALRGPLGNMNVLIAADTLDYAAYQSVALLSYPDHRIIATAILKRDH